MPKSGCDVSKDDEIKTVILIEDTGSLSAHENAKALSTKTGFEVFQLAPEQRKHKFAGKQWQLVFTKYGLVLRLSSEPSWSDIRVDFASAALAYRKQHGGGRKEPLAKAIGIKSKEVLTVVDCTAGMGTDSFVMASVGATVTMLERSKVVAALLEDGIHRANEAALDIASRMQLRHADASQYLQSIDPLPDVVYLDPMFPHKKKSAMVKKEMQAFQMLLGADTDSHKLIDVALKRAKQRIVVKRPNYADPIDNAEARLPDMAIKSKKHRFDVYIQK
ncbi:class I SAM-dependent methyltransferase [Agaribacter marinus]|uniref:Ribosomal RNA small subunit methyltransferase J n=1 Tax=Agaribacter marinus TaxID=1431249 RepID=A0AA37SW61_9ALTE|nr:class I SAM-dependent methyltransferase [Agaribacter marinus]GLR69285.1 ribosomal RNA small subunit methyltransferase J [Agaribacter marinus]